MLAHACTHTLTHARTHAHTHTRTHTRAHTHTHTHTHVIPQGLLDLVEMVMAKTDPRVTRMYDTKLVRPELQASPSTFLLVSDLLLVSDVLLLYGMCFADES